MPSTHSPLGALKEFHDAVEAGGKTVRYLHAPDAWGRRQVVDLRTRLIEEEFREVMDELLDHQNGVGDYANLAKELADLLYVVYGAAEALDIPLAEVFDEVHRSNMTKVVNGKVTYRADGKVRKGPGYSPADIESVLGDMSL